MRNLSNHLQFAAIALILNNSVHTVHRLAIPTKIARNAAKMTDKIADGPAICRTTCPIITNMVIANVELNATCIKSNNLNDFCGFIFETDVIISTDDDRTASVDPIPFI